MCIRDSLKVGFYTEVMFPDMDVRFIAIGNGIDSINQQDSDFTPFLNIINEWYLKDSSKKIRAVFKAKGEAGEHIASHPPYGYVKDKENPKQWVVDEAAAGVVQRIFSLCMDGYGPVSYTHLSAGVNVAIRSTKEPSIFKTSEANCPCPDSSAARSCPAAFNSSDLTVTGCVSCPIYDKSTKRIKLSTVQSVPAKSTAQICMVSCAI